MCGWQIRMYTIESHHLYQNELKLVYVLYDVEGGGIVLGNGELIIIIITHSS